MVICTKIGEMTSGSLLESTEVKISGVLVPWLISLSIFLRQLVHDRLGGLLSLGFTHGQRTDNTIVWMLHQRMM